jgi:hypothetical protein
LSAVGWYEDEVDAWIHARIRGIGPALPIKKPKQAAAIAGAEAGR